MSNTLIQGKTTDGNRLPIVALNSGEIANRLSPDSATGTLLSVKITLGAATAFAVTVTSTTIKGFYVVTSLTDLRYAYGENPTAINATAETVSPVDEGDMTVGNDLASLQTRLIPDGATRSLRFFSQAGGDIILNLFG